jgi:cellulose 1,4-beta-cellobiosidase
LAAQKRTRQKQLVQIVVYNLPDRDCSAKASDGEFHLSDDGLNKYKGFIDGKYRDFLWLRDDL